MHIEDWNSTDCVAIFPRPAMRRLDIPDRQVNRFRKAFCQGLAPLHGLDTKQDDFFDRGVERLQRKKPRRNEAFWSAAYNQPNIGSGGAL
jgi:hypothetical protein